MKKELVLKIFEAFSIQRWNDLVRPFELVEMDKAAEKMILAYVIGKFEENRGVKIDWIWIINASLFDLLKKIALCDIKAPVQQMLKKEFPDEYMRLNEWVLNQYKLLMNDDELFSQFTLYIGQKAGSFEIPDEAKSAVHVYNAAHKFSTIRELQMLSVVNERERIEKIEKDLQSEIQPYLDLSGLQMLINHQKAFDLVMKIEQLRFQTRWNQTPRVPKTSVLGHSYFVAIMTLLLGRESKQKKCQKRIINNFFSALFHDLPESVTRDIISPVKQATDELPFVVKNIENKIVSKELLPLMEDFFKDEIIYYTSEEFSNRIKNSNNETIEVSYEELNEKYNSDEYSPIDGKLVRISDHLSALLEATISINHGITSSHLVTGRDSLLNHYAKNKIINEIDVYKYFNEFV